jgi:hypothetical protein
MVKLKPMLCLALFQWHFEGHLIYLKRMFLLWARERAFCGSFVMNSVEMLYNIFVVKLGETQEAYYV